MFHNRSEHGGRARACNEMWRWSCHVRPVPPHKILASVKHDVDVITAKFDGYFDSSGLCLLCETTSETSDINDGKHGGIVAKDECEFL